MATWNRANAIVLDGLGPPARPYDDDDAASPVLRSASKPSVVSHPDAVLHGSTVSRAPASPRAARIALRVLECQERVQRYLSHVEPARVRHTTELLTAYGLADTALFDGMAHADDAERAIADRERAVMADLERHYGVSEVTAALRDRHSGAVGSSGVRAADVAAAAEHVRSAADDRLSNRDWVKAFDVEYGLFRERPRTATAALAPAYPPRTFGTGLSASERGELPSAPFAVHGASKEMERFARDHTVYARGAVPPEGFHREEALCPVCGIEALNPAELHRHMRFRHPDDGHDKPASVAKSYSSVLHQYTRRISPG